VDTTIKGAFWSLSINIQTQVRFLRGRILFAFSRLAAFIFFILKEKDREREEYIYTLATTITKDSQSIKHPNIHPYLIKSISLIYKVKIMMSSPQKLLFTFLFLCSTLLTLRVAVTAEIRHRRHHHSHEAVKKLFVFGDSYVDTGNNRKSLGSSWKDPYGITFPGKPTGRFSDGRVFTDFLGSLLF